PDHPGPAVHGQRNRPPARPEGRLSLTADAGRYRPDWRGERDHPAAARNHFAADDHDRSAPPDDYDRSADAWEGRPAADEARRPAAALVERLSLETAETHRNRPAADQNLDEVKHRLDGLTQQLSRLAEMNAAQASHINRRDEETPHQLVDAISRIDSRLNQL